MPPRVIFFDLGGVVCRFRPERRLAALGEACGVAADRVHAELYASGLVAEWDRGPASAGQIHGAVLERLGFTGDVRALQRIWCRAFEPDPAVLALVDGVRPVPTALLTDNDHLLLEAVPEELPQVASRFDALLFSCRLGATKPDPAVFARALDAMGTGPGEAVLVDDGAANVAAARELGIHALHFRDAAGLGDALDGILGR